MFRDVLLDRLIAGEQYRPSDLAPGRYYWRVAPSQFETGQFVKPIAFQVRIIEAAPTPSLNSGILTFSVSPGWLAATGTIQRLLAVGSGNSSAPDFIAVNSENTVFAIDGVKGIARWAARFVQGTVSFESRESHFTPLVIGTVRTYPLIVIAFEKGIRAVEGQTGRPLWRTQLSGRAVGGVVVSSPGENPAVYVVDDKLNQLFLLDGLTGEIRKQTKLEGRPLGPPVLLPGQGLLIPVKNRAIELRNFSGAYIRSIALASEMTTPPVIVSTHRGMVLLVGTRNGLAAFDTKTFLALGQMAIERGEYPVGSLSVADLDGDKTPDVVMLTNRGRVAAADVALGKTKWLAKIVAKAEVVDFADVDGDGRADVVLPGPNTFAAALSGIDGSLIWQSDEMALGSSKPIPARLLVTAKASDGRLMMAGSDPSGAGLRGMELHRVSASQKPR